jgi:hypothetical protein
MLRPVHVLGDAHLPLRQEVLEIFYALIIHVDVNPSELIEQEIPESVDSVYLISKSREHRIELRESSSHKLVDILVRPELIGVVREMGSPRALTSLPERMPL